MNSERVLAPDVLMGPDESLFPRLTDHLVCCGSEEHRVSTFEGEGPSEQTVDACGSNHEVLTDIFDFFPSFHHGLMNRLTESSGEVFTANEGL